MLFVHFKAQSGLTYQEFHAEQGVACINAILRWIADLNKVFWSNLAVGACDVALKACHLKKWYYFQTSSLSANHRMRQNL